MEIVARKERALPDSTRIELTGNPFVDTGLAVIAARRPRGSIDDLSLGHLRSVHKDGVELAKQCELLKCFTMVFTRNSILTNGPKKYKNRRIKMHAAITTEILNSIGNETEDAYCEACGNQRTINLSNLANRALSRLGEAPRDTFIGRHWFPMAGSLGSDAQALPAASRAPAICAKCLFAVQYLPLGVRLFGRDLAVFQSNSVGFWYEIVHDITRVVTNQIAQGKPDILGSREGRAGLAKQLLELFSQLQTNKRFSNLEKDTHLYVWRFANSTSPNIEIDHIPSHALSFLYEASTKWGLKNDILRILSRERVPEAFSFFTCVVAKKDYKGLYPGKLGKEKGYPGASHDLFYLYQTWILNRTSESLKAAYTLAKSGVERFKEDRGPAQATRSRMKRSEEKQWGKELERKSRPEAFRDPSTRSTFRRIMAAEARSGRFDYKRYIELFPYSEEGVRVSHAGWDLIRYYLGATARGADVQFPDSEDSSIPMPSGTISEKVAKSALLVFQRYVRERGANRFEADVLKRLSRGQLGVNWLRIQFARLAREYEGFEYRNWVELCHPRPAQWSISELYFQWRLLWSEWLANQQAIPSEPTVIETGQTLSDVLESSGIPERISSRLMSALDQYAKDRSWERVRDDILLRLQKGEIGLGWFKTKLVYDGQARITEQEFDEFLHDLDGNLRISESVFQMSLLLNNIYRVTQQQRKSVVAKVS